MKIFKLLSILLFIPSLLVGQIYDPVDWDYSSKQISDDEFELYIKATIEDKWHLYSQFLPSDDGPIATEFTFNDNENVEFVGKVKEPKPHKEFDPNFQMDLTFFADEVVFTQLVKLKGNSSTVTGEVYFMVCNDEMCLPPEGIEFSIDLEKSAMSAESKANVEQPIENVVEEEIKISATEESENLMFTPVKWKASTFQENDKYFVKVTAKIDDGWHLYALEQPTNDGPIPTKITFSESKDFQPAGALKIDGVAQTEFDPHFEMYLTYYDEEVNFIQEINPVMKDATVSGNIYFMTCDDKRCLPPASEAFEIALANQKVGELLETKVEETDESGVILNDAQKAKSKGLLAIFFLSFLGGFAALLTPCVFPMIPLTVSFFTKQSKSKAKGLTNAVLYGLSIIFIYVLLGFGVTAIFGADALNALSTNVVFNIFFFLLLTIFAISFFGAFEITLPNSWVNKMDSASDRGGLIGIFFMAFTLSLVSFSCTGPIIGTLLVEAAVNGGVMGPLIGMFGFSLALALPFALFAAFPGWLNSLPQSGGWLNSVKVVLGFLELALALKFLSNADLVVQAGLITREVFIAIWIGIFLMLSLYLLGVYKLPHDSPMDRLSVGRTLFATICVTFTLYLIPGLWGAPLKIISGFPPPMFYSESPQGLITASSGGGGSSVATFEGEVVGEPEHCPHNLPCFHDYDEGMAYAKKVNKPVMLDFTGWACVNCRKMEEQVWSDPRVLEKLREEVVLISLYVDEKLELPQSEQREVEIGGKTKKLKTVGNKWSYFQADRFKTNSQPYYVFLDHQENQLHESAAYDPDINLFINWLDKGVKEFNKSKS